MQVVSAAATFRINNEELPWLAMPEEDCHYQSMPKEIGSGCSRLFKLEPDFNLIESDYLPAKSLAVFSRFDCQEPRMVLTLGLTGQSGFEDSNGDEIVFRAGQCTLTAFNSSEGWRRYQSKQRVNQLRFSMSKTWVDRHFGESVTARFFDKSIARVVAQRPISTSAMPLLHCIKSNAVPANANSLFRQGLAMAIVASELNALINELQPNSLYFVAKDRQFAESAREILQAEYGNPPSLAELSRRIGTNQFKLKHVCRKYFDTTPYGMLLDIRMEKAYRLLKMGNNSVSLVAEAVGYAHASNFSAAFTKYFGFPPKHVSRCN